MKEERLQDRRKDCEIQFSSSPTSESASSSSSSGNWHHHQERPSSNAMRRKGTASPHPIPLSARDQALVAIIAANGTSPSSVVDVSPMASPRSTIVTLSSHLQREYGPVSSPAVGGDTGDYKSVQNKFNCSTASMLVDSYAILNSETALVKAQVEVEQQKHKDKLRRTLKRIQQRLLKANEGLQAARETNQQVIQEMDQLKRGLEYEQQKNQKQQRRATERNDRLLKSRERLRNRIELLEQEKLTWQQEREELTLQLQQQQQQQLDGLATNAFTCPEEGSSTVATTTTIAYCSDEYVGDVQPFDLSTIVESPSESREEVQEFIESIQNAELEEATTKLKFEQKLLKLKNDEMTQLKSVFHKVSSELESMKEDVQRQEEEFFFLKEDVQRQLGSYQYSAEQNSQLEANVELFEGRLQSEHTKMALQEAFVDSLESQIYMGQEAQRKQAEEIDRLRLLVSEIQQREADERFLQSSRKRVDERGHMESIRDGNETIKTNVSEAQPTPNTAGGTNYVSSEMLELLEAYDRSQNEIRSLKDELERIMEEKEIAVREAREDKQAFSEAALAEINRLTGIRDMLQRKNYRQKQAIVDLKTRLGVVDEIAK